MHRRVFLAGAATLLATAARGHSSPGGMEYDAYCCNGKDCHPIDARHVRAARGGFVVTLNVGDHPMVTKPLRVMVAYPDARPATDGEYHACVFPADTLRCLYVPAGGA